MAMAASRAGLKRIIYLGGLGAEDAELSPHLRSRLEVANILRTSTAQVTFLRTAIILGSGSASFEILRYLVDRLPIMITPRWVRVACQPIAIRNVIAYLVGCLEHEETAGETFEICGPDVVTYEDLFNIYAEEAGIPKPIIISAPVLTPKLSSYWISLITPVRATLARPLSLGLKNTVVCRDNRISSIIPQELLSCRETIRIALERIQQQKSRPAGRTPDTPVHRSGCSRAMWPCRRNCPGLRVSDPPQGHSPGSLGAHSPFRRD